MNLVLLGPPGAGKGTQAKLLSDYFKIPHISTGDILREAVKKGSELGKKAKDFMDKGSLVPDNLVTEIIEQRLQESDILKGFILDGFPRTILQAEKLDSILKKMLISIDYVVYLETSEATIIQRLSGRRICPNCGAIFHLKNMPPKIDMLCDLCRAQLYQRPDDWEEKIKNRIKVYLDETASLIKYYENQEKLFRVSADSDSNVVFKELLYSGKLDNSE